jgi:hypothetical protein
MLCKGELWWDRIVGLQMKEKMQQLEGTKSVVVTLLQVMALLHLVDLVKQEEEGGAWRKTFW